MFIYSSYIPLINPLKLRVKIQFSCTQILSIHSPTTSWILSQNGSRFTYIEYHKFTFGCFAKHYFYTTLTIEFQSIVQLLRTILLNCFYRLFVNKYGQKKIIAWKARARKHQRTMPSLVSKILVQYHIKQYYLYS